MSERIPLTTSGREHGYAAGDILELRRLDQRLWKRILHFITFQAPPTIAESVKITAITETTITITELCKT